MKKFSLLLVFALVLMSGFISVPKAEAAVSVGAVAGTTAADLVVGTANADYNVSFDTNTTSTATTITVTFPAGYVITNGSLGTSAICNSGCVTPGFISVDGVDRSIDSVIGSLASSTIKATLTSGYDLGTGTGTSFRITTGVTNATTSGVTGTFSITSNASGETAQTNIAGVTLTPGTATQLAFTTQPLHSTSSIALVQQPVVTARDTYGNTDTNFVSTVTLTEASAGSLTNNTEAAVSGVANFATGDDLIYTASADQESFTLTATSGALSTSSDAVTSNVVATKVIVYTNPTSTVSGVSMTQPVIRFVDAQNTLDTAANTDVITASVFSGGGTVSGNTISSAVNGVSTFSGLIYSSSTDQSAFVLRFTDDAAGTNAFNGAPVDASSTLSNVVATVLVFTTQPASATSGIALVTQPVVTARNAAGATDTDFVEVITMTEASAGSLTAGATTTAASGVATFSGLTYTASVDQEAFTLTADDVAGGAEGDLTPVVANAVTSDVVATKVIVFTNPTSSISGVSMSQPVIRFVDAQNTLDAAISTDVVTASVFSGSGTVSGNTTSSASSGVATFSGLIYTSSTDQSAFVLRFTDDAAGAKNFSAAPADASSTLTNVLATVIAFTTQPLHSTSSVALVQQPVVTARNASGYIDTDFTETITLTEASAGSLTNNTQAAVSGVATFTTLTYTASADQESFTLTADDVAGGAEGDLATTTASAVTSDVVATKVIVFTNPTSSISGVSMSQPVIRFVDAQNTLDAAISTDVVTASVFSGSGTVSGNTTSSASSGVATFSGLIYTSSTDQSAFVLRFTDDAAGAKNFSAAPADASSTLTNVLATVIVLTTQPADSGATNGHARNGIAFITQPIVTYRNAAGATDTDINADVVTVSLTAGSGTFSGTTSTTATNGVATFSGLTYTLAGGENDQQVITLSFVDNSGGSVNFSGSPVTDNSTVDVVATQIAIQTQPSTIVSGVSMIQPVVRYLDALSKVDTNVTETITASENGNGYISAGTSTAAVSGVATFSGLVYNALADGESVTLTFTDDVAGINLSGSPVSSNALTANVVATKIIVNTQPAGSVSGIALTTQPVIYFTNADNILDTQANTDVVTASVFSGGGAASGGTTASASSGVATFSGLIYTSSTDQSAFVLRFTDDAGGTNAFSGSPVNASSILTNVVATKFLVTLATSTPTVGSADTMTLTAANTNNATDTEYSAGGKTYSFLDASSTALSSHTSPFGTSPTIPSSATVISAFSSGVASLSTFTLVKAETLGTITVNDGTLVGTSTSVTVRHAVASTYSVTPSTATPTAGTAFNLTVAAKDTYGNMASGVNGTAYTGTALITASATAPYTLSPSLHPFISDNAGTKTFINGVTLNTAENNVTITVRDLTDATITSSTVVNVSATADTTAPVITNVQVSTTTATTATITWTTNESASSTVQYVQGTTSNYNLSSTSSTLVTSHSVNLTGLSANTTYHFRVKSTDASGNTGTSVDNTFMTNISDTTGPTISSQSPIDGATTTAITASPTLTFNEALDASTVNGATIQLRTYSDDSAVSATVLYNSSTYVVTVDPVASLGYSTQYYLWVSGVKDASSNALTTDYSSSTKASHEFTTVAEGNGSLAVGSIKASSTYATVGGGFSSGWSWIFGGNGSASYPSLYVTVPTSETSSTMKFADWVSGSNTIAAASNIRFYSAQSSNASTTASAITISAADTYGSYMTLTSDLDATTVGRQIQITVEAQVPTGSAAGSYSTSYGIKSE